VEEDAEQDADGLEIEASKAASGNAVSGNDSDIWKRLALISGSDDMKAQSGNQQHQHQHAKRKQSEVSSGKAEAEKKGEKTRATKKTKKEPKKAAGAVDSDDESWIYRAQPGKRLVEKGAGGKGKGAAAEGDSTAAVAAAADGDDGFEVVSAKHGAQKDFLRAFDDASDAESADDQSAQHEAHHENGMDVEPQASAATAARAPSVSNKERRKKKGGGGGSAAASTSSARRAASTSSTGARKAKKPK
jgi:hypothetical protein